MCGRRLIDKREPRTILNALTTYTQRRRKDLVVRDPLGFVGELHKRALLGATVVILATPIIKPVEGM